MDLTSEGLIQIFESGVSNNVLRFDLYSERGLEFEDPVSKLKVRKDMLRRYGYIDWDGNTRR
jgi:hypothetical protein